MKHLKLILLLIPFIGFSQVGVEIEVPTETLHVQGTTRLNAIPNNESTNVISTLPDGNASLNGDGTLNKNQSFAPTKTVVVDDNGVLGTVTGLAVVELPNIKTIKYVTKTVPINGQTPTNSIIELGNLRIKFNTTNPSDTGAEIQLMLVNNILNANGTAATKDYIIVNQWKVGSGGNNNIYGGQEIIPLAKKDVWTTDIGPGNGINVRNADFGQYMIAILNTKELYRLSISLNKAETIGSESVPAQVTLFLERLTNQ